MDFLLAAVIGVLLLVWREGIRSLNWICLLRGGEDED